MTHVPSSNSFYLANHLFFLIEEGKVLVWNYKEHEQYVLEHNYFLELLHISQTNQSNNDSISQELLAAQLISKALPTQQHWEWDVLSKIFHTGTQNVCKLDLKMDKDLFSKNYLSQSEQLNEKLPNLFIEKGNPSITLPSPNYELFKYVSLYSVLKNRKTCREFQAEKSITLDELSLILHASFGLIHGTEWDELEKHQFKQAGIRKASPSSGATHPEEGYVVVYRVEGLEPGLYHYRPQDHNLGLLKAGYFEQEVIEMNYNQFYSEGLAFGIYITARLDRIWWKYKHSRSYRTMLLDIGHLSQTFLNCLTGLGLQSWLTGAFYDSQVEKFLELDDSQEAETVILFVGGGKGKDQAIPQAMLDQLNSVRN